MSTEEIIFKTKVQTGDSDKKVKSLKEEMEDLKKAEVDLDKVNKDINKSFQQIYGDLQPLSTRLGEAEDRMYELALAGKRNTEEFKALQAQVVSYRQTLISVDAEVDALAQRGGNLKAALELGSAVTAGYGAYQGVVALVGTENEALAETFIKLQAVQTVLSSIEAIRASLQKESMLVTKAKVVWTKVATAGEYMYATAVGTTTGAMKALRIAMLAIPILAIIAGIMALVGAVAYFTGEQAKAEEQNKRLNESFDKQNEALEANSRAFQRNADNKRALMVSENATAEELFNFDKKRLLDEEIMRKKNMSFLVGMINKKRSVYFMAQAEENYELAKSIREEIKTTRDKYKSLVEMKGQYDIDRKLLENKYKNEVAKEQEQAEKEEEKKREEAERKARERRAQNAQKRADEQKLLEDLIVLNIADADARKIAQLKLQHEREIAEVRKKYGQNSSVIKEMEQKQFNEKFALLEELAKAEDARRKAEDAKIEEEKKAKAESDREALKQKIDRDRRDEKATLEAKLLAVKEDFELEQDLKRELARFEMVEALSQENLTEGEKFKIREEYALKIDALNKELAEEEKRRQYEVVNVSKKIMEMGLEASQNLADAFFDYRIEKAEKGSAEELKLEKKKFEINKKLQVAQAVMQGIQATLAAYSSGSAIPIVGAVTGPLFASFAAITAGLNIAKIKNTSFEGGGIVSTPSASAPSVNVPTVQGNEQPTTTLTEGLTGNQGVSKVVLVDSELKASLKDNEQVSIVSSIG
jgi:hypothetical protein